MKTEELTLEGERILLRPMVDEDEESLWNHVKDKEIAATTYVIPYPYPRELALEFINRCKNMLKEKKGYVFGITLKEGEDKGKAIGVVALENVHEKDRSAELGYWIGKKYWNQGLMSEAVRLTVGFGFRKLNLHRIYAYLYENNPGSEKILQKMGFVKEGLERETDMKEGKWMNTLIYGILEHEFK